MTNIQVSEEELNKQISNNLSQKAMTKQKNIAQALITGIAIFIVGMSASIWFWDGAAAAFGVILSIALAIIYAVIGTLYQIFALLGTQKEFLKAITLRMGWKEFQELNGRKVAEQNLVPKETSIEEPVIIQKAVNEEILLEDNSNDWKKKYETKGPVSISVNENLK